jgi:hypothetical protein
MRKGQDQRVIEWFIRAKVRFIQAIEGELFDTQMR